MEIKEGDVLLCEFYFSDLKKSKNIPKLMIRKTFVVSKDVVQKRYGTLSQQSFAYYHGLFCKYFGCDTI